MSASLYTRAGDTFSMVDESNAHDTVLRVAAYGLTIYTDVMAGRIRPTLVFEAFGRRVDALTDVSTSQTQLLCGVAVMVKIAYELEAQR